MNKTCKISETEWQLMRILWKEGPLTGTELLEHLRKDDRDWHSKTARTLLGRLVRKRALAAIPEGRAYRYRPVVSEKECVAAESQNFLDRMFGGSLKPMLAHFLETKPMKPEELQELRELLETNPSPRGKKVWKKPPNS